MATKLEQLIEYVAPMSDSEKEYFALVFPKRTDDWYGNSYSPKDLKTNVPKIQVATAASCGYEKGVEVQALLDSKSYGPWLKAMSQIRRIYPPHAAGKMLYRLTGTPALPEGPRVIFNSETQKKAATSWTLKDKPYVAGRSTTQPYDIVLEYKAQGRKHILFDSEMLWELVQDVTTNWKHLAKEAGLTKYTADRWLSLQNIVRDYRTKEQEVVLYLNHGEDIICEWKEVYRSDKARDDGGGWDPQKKNAPAPGQSSDGIAGPKPISFPAPAAGESMKLVSLWGKGKAYPPQTFFDNDASLPSTVLNTEWRWFQFKGQLTLKGNKLPEKEPRSVVLTPDMEFAVSDSVPPQITTYIKGGFNRRTYEISISDALTVVQKSVPHGLDIKVHKPKTLGPAPEAQGLDVEEYMDLAYTAIKKGNPYGPDGAKGNRYFTYQGYDSKIGNGSVLKFTQPLAPKAEYWMSIIRDGKEQGEQALSAPEAYKLLKNSPPFQGPEAGSDDSDDALALAALEKGGKDPSSPKYRYFKYTGSGSNNGNVLAFVIDSGPQSMYSYKITKGNTTTTTLSLMPSATVLTMMKYLAPYTPGTGNQVDATAVDAATKIEKGPVSAPDLVGGKDYGFYFTFHGPTPLTVGKDVFRDGDVVRFKAFTKPQPVYYYWKRLSNGSFDFATSAMTAGEVLSFMDSAAPYKKGDGQVDVGLPQTLKDPLAPDVDQSEHVVKSEILTGGKFNDSVSRQLMDGKSIVDLPDLTIKNANMYKWFKYDGKEASIQGYPFKLGDFFGLQTTTSPTTVNIFGRYMKYKMISGGEANWLMQNSVPVREDEEAGPSVDYPLEAQHVLDSGGINPPAGVKFDMEGAWFTYEGPPWSAAYPPIQKGDIIVFENPGEPQLKYSWGYLLPEGVKIAKSPMLAKDIAMRKQYLRPLKLSAPKAPSPQQQKKVAPTEVLEPPSGKQGPGPSTSVTPTPGQEPPAKSNTNFTLVPDVVYDSGAEVHKYKVPAITLKKWGSKIPVQKLEQYKWYQNKGSEFVFSEGFQVPKTRIVGIKPVPRGTKMTEIVRSQTGEIHRVSVAECEALVKQCSYAKGGA